jgi:hypothetical protein
MDKESRMVKTLILWAYFVAGMIVATNDCNTDIVVSVNRRSTDIIYYYQATSNAPDCQHTCHDETFLIVEQQCTNNSNFFNGKLYIS